MVGDASLAHCLDAQLSLPSGATLEASGVVTVLAGTGNGALNLTGGTLRAPSVVRQSGAFTWDGGTLAITGAGGVSLGGGQLLGTNYTHALARTLQVTNALTVPAGTAFTLAGDWR